MANVTLKVDDEILKKARDLANQRNTSINAIVRQTLEDFVTKDRNRKAALEGLESLWQKTEARIGKKKWTRDELHER
jgi:predicted transcriptional regulator